jgi:dihydroorotase
MAVRSPKNLILREEAALRGVIAQSLEVSGAITSAIVMPTLAEAMASAQK